MPPVFRWAKSRTATAPSGRARSSRSESPANRERRSAPRRNAATRLGAGPIQSMPRPAAGRRNRAVILFRRSYLFIKVVVNSSRALQLHIFCSIKPNNQRLKSILNNYHLCRYYEPSRGQVNGFLKKTGPQQRSPAQTKDPPLPPGRPDIGKCPEYSQRLPKVCPTEGLYPQHTGLKAPWFRICSPGARRSDLNHESSGIQSVDGRR